MPSRRNNNLQSPRRSRRSARKNDNIVDYIKNSREKSIQFREESLVVLEDSNDDGFIVLKQESIYKPLLVVFGFFLFMMVILFPNSIMDSL